MNLPMYAQAACWGLLAGSGLIVGAVIAVAFAGRLSHRIIATVMGFGGGVLIAVLSVDLMDSAFTDGASRGGHGRLLVRRYGIQRHQLAPRTIRGEAP